MKILTSLVILVAAAAPAHAQSDTTAYLRSAIHPGQTVWITSANGRELQGTLAGISDGAIDVTMLGNTVTYPFTDVRRIEVPDPIINGLLVGGLMGTLVGSIPAWDVHRSRSSAFISTLAGAGVGAAGGAYFDYLRQGRKMVLKNAVIVSVAPIVLPTTFAFNATVRW